MPTHTTAAAAATLSAHNTPDRGDAWSRIDGYREVLRRCSPLAGAPPLDPVEAARALERCVSDEVAFLRVDRLENPFVSITILLSLYHTGLPS